MARFFNTAGPSSSNSTAKTAANFKREKALDQICNYMERMSVGSGYLVIFRKKMLDPEAVGQRETVEHRGKIVHIIWV